MKQSFIKKIFSGVFTLLVIIFLVQIVFQKYIFPIYYLNQVKNNIESELVLLVDSTTKSQFSDNLDRFSQITQTTTATVPTQSAQIPVNEYPLTIIKTSGDELYSLFIPKFTDFSLKPDDSVSGTFYMNTNNNSYIPKVLLVNGERIYGETRSPSHKKSNMYNELIMRSSIDTTKTFELSGFVLEIDEKIIEESKDLNASREWLNLYSGNVTKLTETSNGLSYISNDVDNNPTNLVYTSRVTLDGKEQLAITIYPLSNISLISAKLTNFNIVMYLFAFVVLLVLSVFYIKRVSVPLIKINETTKRLANLDFTLIEEIDSDDEIGQLSRSINLLSANLKTALSELNDKNEQLSSSISQESEREKSRIDFVAGLSHELKTPLAVIQASSEGLSLDLFDKVDKTEQHEIIKNEIVRSNKIIQDMMQVYKLEQTVYKSNWKSFKLSETISKVNESLSLLANAKGIETIINTDDSFVYGDENKFELVISNLFSNAIKYTNEDEKIVINLKDGFFEIINTGITIPDKYIKNIFEPFYRVDKSRSRSTGSTGLGLYIVKQILNQHNFEYGAENLDNAIRFYFTIKKD